MASTKDNQIKAEAYKKVKIETTYHCVPLLGEILGYWRKVNDFKVGEEIELNICTPLSKYDRLIVNGKEVPIPID